MNFRGIANGGQGSFFKATVIIAVMVSISVGLRFVQEFRSSRAAERLQAMVGTTATVSRPGPRVTNTLPLGEEPHSRDAPHHPPTREEVPIKLLVPGDVVHLSAGDMVLADLVLLSCKDLFVSQSLLTGESLPVEKSSGPVGRRQSEACHVRTESQPPRRRPARRRVAARTGPTRRSPSAGSKVALRRG